MMNITKDLFNHLDCTDCSVSNNVYTIFLLQKFVLTWSFSEEVFLSQTSIIMKLFLILSSNDCVKSTGAIYSVKK